MLRVELSERADTLTMRLEGRFVDNFATETEALVARCKVPGKLIVDVTELTFVDAVGEQVLSALGRMGGQFIADRSYARDVCERLRLKALSRSRKKSA